MVPAFQRTWRPSQLRWRPCYFEVLLPQAIPAINQPLHHERVALEMMPHRLEAKRQPVFARFGSPSHRLKDKRRSAHQRLQCTLGSRGPRKTALHEVQLQSGTEVSYTCCRKATNKTCSNGAAGGAKSCTKTCTKLSCHWACCHWGRHWHCWPSRLSSHAAPG